MLFSAGTYLKKIIIKAGQKFLEVYALIGSFEKKLEKKWTIKKLKDTAQSIHWLFGKYFWKISEIIFFIIVSISLLQGYLWRAPNPFPEHILITVEKGENLSGIASDLKNKKIIISPFWLKIFVIMRGGEKKVIAGDYYFPKPISLFEISRSLTRGKYGLSPIKVVIPEGLNSLEMATLLSQNLPRFDQEKFVNEARYYEGFLFPDTYFLMPNQKPSEIVSLMRENFARQVNYLIPEIEKFGRTLDEIVVMASIIEDEARKMETRRIVSGILWKRLKLEMPLQVDAAFKYYNGKTSFDLTIEDLEENNPYNTYKNKGLPPTAITNPGLDSIRAAIAPTNTEYLYFLSDKNGIMHYAVDFDGHKRNKELYLR